MLIGQFSVTKNCLRDDIIPWVTRHAFSRSSSLLFCSSKAFIQPFAPPLPITLNSRPPCAIRNHRVSIHRGGSNDTFGPSPSGSIIAILARPLHCCRRFVDLSGTLLSAAICSRLLADCPNALNQRPRSPSPQHNLSRVFTPTTRSIPILLAMSSSEDDRPLASKKTVNGMYDLLL